MFRNDRALNSKKWGDDIRIFIVYGMMTDEKFGVAAGFCLLKRHRRPLLIRRIQRPS